MWGERDMLSLSLIAFQQKTSKETLREAAAVSSLETGSYLSLHQLKVAMKHPLIRIDGLMNCLKLGSKPLLGEKKHGRDEWNVQYSE